MDTHLIGGLNVGVVELGPTARVELDYVDKDVALNDRIGEISITRELARQVADCGPIGVILTPQAMDLLSTRIHAVEIELTSVP